MYFINQGGIEELSISGGEPFLHPDLFEMVKFCKDKGIRTVIFTSGIKRATEIPSEIIEYIKNKCSRLRQTRRTKSRRNTITNIKRKKLFQNRFLKYTK